MPEQQKDFLSSFLTHEQVEAIAKLKDSLRPEEIAELRSAGERLLKNVKTEKDLANLIESAARSGAMPDIKSPRLRKIVGGMARSVSSRSNESVLDKDRKTIKSGLRRSVSRKAASTARSRRQRSARKKP